MHTDDELIGIDREFNLGLRGFADIRVQVPGKRAYFVEVKYGHPSPAIVKNLIRKYAPATDVSKVILVVDTAALEDWAACENQIRSSISIELEV